MTECTSLLAPDLALPHRDVLFDEETMRGRLAAAFGSRRSAPIERCKCVRVNYQVGRSLRVLYALGADGERLVATRMFREGKSADAYARAIAARPETSPGVAYDRDIDVVCWAFPLDRKIRTLPDVMNPVNRLDDRVPGGWRSSRVMAYAPEKSATAACLDRMGRVAAFVKVTAGDQARRDRDYYEHLNRSVGPDDPFLHVPRTLSFSEAHRMLWLEAVAGPRLGEGPQDRTKDVTALGTALARFHQCSVSGAPAFTRFASDRLDEAARMLVSVRPDVGSRVLGLVRQLSRSRPVGAAPVCLHGDVHPKNVIVTNGRATLLDVEDLAVGPAAADLGSFIASLAYLYVGGRIGRDDYEADVAAFRAGYARIRDLPGRGEVAWHTAAALFIERSARAVTRVRPLGLGNLDGLLAYAASVLARGVHG